MPDESQGSPPGPQRGTAVSGWQARAASQDCHRPMPASLLRRLAEAADGLIGPNWIVASYTLIDGEHDIFGPPYDSRAEAESHVPSADYDVFGPYGVGAMNRPRPVIDRFDVNIRGGSLKQIPGAAFDAFFWSDSALRKFALPYYARVVSPEYAIALREKFKKPDIVMMAHDPLTEYSMISIDRLGKALPV